MPHYKKGFSEILVVLVVGVVAAAGLGYYYFNQNQSVEIDSYLAADPVSVDLSSEITELLDRKLVLVENSLANDPELIEMVANQQEHDDHMDEQRMHQLDKDWQEGEVEEFVMQHNSNEVALKLLEFTENNPGFVEIIVTDAQGLNVGQTNRTTDFVQSDEQWWQDAYSEGKGKSYYGEVEFDESAASESISMHLPIYDSESNVVGIIKAVLDLRSIQDEL